MHGHALTSKTLELVFVILMLFFTMLLGVTEGQEKKESARNTGNDMGLPLKAERTIEFTTDEGTWLSLDVSPDGKMIVFELLGDIYTLPLAGGEARLVSGGIPFDSQPKFSPDGQWVAFVSDRDGNENIWIMHPNGSGAKQVSNVPDNQFASPSWAADGQSIFVSKRGFGLLTYELWMYYVQGGSGVQITKAKPTPATSPREERNAIGAVASPDGEYLYYALRQGGFAPNEELGSWEIARRDLRTGDEDIVLRQPGGSFRPVLSADGSQLVYLTRYQTETGMRLRTLRTGEDRWVRYPVTRDDQQSRSTRDLFPGYAFLPSGKEIVYNQDGKIRRLELATSKDTVIPFVAHVTQELGPALDFPQRVEDGPVKARLIQGAVVSPNGKKLVFSAMTHLYVLDLPEGKPRRLTAGNTREFQPTWSPDGRSIAYVTWSAKGGQLWKISVVGGTAQQLTKTPALYSDPAWSPDGTRIVVLRGNVYDRPVGGTQAFNADLIWVPAESSEEDGNLILPARGASKPHFTHEENRVYVYTSQGLVSVRYDGTDRRTHIQVKGQGVYFDEEPVLADDVRISPDGKWVLAHLMNQLYLISMPIGGRESLTVNVMSASVPVKRLTDIGADYFAWADGGKTITWTVGASFFREPLCAVSSDLRGKAEGTDEPNNDTKTSEAAKKKVERFRERDENVHEIAVDLEFPRKTPKGLIVLRGATVVTMKGDEVIGNADIVVENNRFKSVGAKGRVPAGARVLDVTGKTIVPGFVDTHAHWYEIRRGILDTQNWDFMVNLAYGVTTGLDVQTFTNDTFAYEDLVDAGEIIGLRAFSTGPGVLSDNKFESVEEMKGVLTKYREYYRTHNIKSYMIGNRRQRQFMVEASKELEMMPTTEGALDLKLDMTHVIDGFHGNEHYPTIAPLYKDVIQMFARSGIAETPTLIVNYGGPYGEVYWFENTEVHDNKKLNHFTPQKVIDSKTRRRAEGWFRKDEYAFPKFAAQVAKILRAGGLVGVGSHGELQGLGYHWEMWMLASGGMTPMEVLRCATANGAKIIGRPWDLGSIETGKLADLVIMDKNPLDDIHNTNTIRWVMKNGELFEGDTLDEVWPEEKKLEPLWFWNYDQPKLDDPLSYGKTTQP